MKKTILALALAGLTLGAFAQSAPAKKSKPAAAVKTAKADTVKQTKTVKKVHKKATKK